MRVNYFTSNVNKPVRFRHSIGSVSLLLGTQQECSFGDEEVDRFFETYLPCNNVTSVVAVPTKTELDKFSVNQFLKDVRDRVDVSKKCNQICYYSMGHSSFLECLNETKV